MVLFNVTAMITSDTLRHFSEVSEKTKFEGCIKNIFTPKRRK
jgi:hypothetical protein